MGNLEKLGNKKWSGKSGINKKKVRERSGGLFSQGKLPLQQGT
jgi:hypothetical protein